MSVSVVIRTYNEALHLPALFGGISEQRLDGMSLETVVVDSGSEDRSVELAQEFGARVVHIAKGDFTFGRSLNVGCEAARGEYLVFVSGHCVPASAHWIRNLVTPLASGRADYSYGRQVGNERSRFSECQLFRKHYPEISRIPTDDFFCNNANAALRRSVWERFRFDEDLTGLEDMELGSRLVRDALKIAYVAEAPVVHLHDESWGRVRIRYEREAMALQRIMPQVHVSLLDFLRYFSSAVALDMVEAARQQVLIGHARDILMFRLMQFWGSYRGNHGHRKLSREMKERYFYPK